MELAVARAAQPARASVKGCAAVHAADEVHSRVGPRNALIVMLQVKRSDQLGGAQRANLGEKLAVDDRLHVPKLSRTG
jgi:hypothetical protein